MRVVLAAGNSPWAFGWEAIVGFGTLALALFTALLAIGTRRLARLTSNEIDAAWRPILVPASKMTFEEEEPDPQTPLARPMYLNVDVKNEGRGPALQVRTLYRDDGYYDRESNSWTRARWDIRTYSREFTFIGVEEQVTLRFYLNLGGRPEYAGWRGTIGIEYHDLSGKVFSTEFSGSLLSWDQAQDFPPEPKGLKLLARDSDIPPKRLPGRPGRPATRGKPLRPRLRAAWAEIWQVPGQPPRPLSKRLRFAREALRQSPRSQTHLQRLIAAYQWGFKNPGGSLPERRWASLKYRVRMTRLRWYENR